MNLPKPKNGHLRFSRSEILKNPQSVASSMLGTSFDEDRAEAMTLLAEDIASTIPARTGDLLRLALPYHNIGDSKDLEGESVFSPLRGAIWAKAAGLPAPVVTAIFELSGARLLARVYPEAEHWYLKNAEKPIPVSLYLTYCDLRVGAGGKRLLDVSSG